MRLDFLESASKAPVDSSERHAVRGMSCGWWDGMQYGFLVVALGYLYAPVLPHLVADWWNDANYSHGFLIPVLSLYLLWERRQQLARVHVAWDAWGLLLILLGLGMLFLGELGAELFFMRVSLIVVIAGLAWVLFGRQCLRVLAFPIVFLLGMIPLPAILLNNITLPLQLLAARLATTSLQLFDLPVYREGNVIFLPHATLEVVEACSGIRSLMTMTVLAVMLAYFTQPTTGRRLLLGLSAMPVAIVANAWRIWGTGVLAYFYGAGVADDFYHTFAGWLVFVVAFVMLGLEGLVISWLGRQRGSTEAQA